MGLHGPATTKTPDQAPPPWRSRWNCARGIHEDACMCGKCKASIEANRAVKRTLVLFQCQTEREWRKGGYMPPLVRTMGKEMSFDLFWKQYPRKIAKRAAEKAWKKLSTTEQQQALEAIPCHTRYWKARDTQQEFIPHASTWLNQGRWEDEIEIKQSTEIKVAWWSSESAMLEKGREYNIAPRPGEDWQQFKGRLASLIQRAA